MANKLKGQWLIRTPVKNHKIVDLRASKEYDDICRFEEEDPQKFAEQYGRKCPPQIVQPQSYLFHTQRMYKEALDKAYIAQDGTFLCVTEEEARYVWSHIKDTPGAYVDPVSETLLEDVAEPIVLEKKPVKVK